MMIRNLFSPKWYFFFICELHEEGIDGKNNDGCDSEHAKCYWKRNIYENGK